MTFRNKLENLGACKASLEWVKDKTIEEAWETCEDSQWMLWILAKTYLDLIDPLCDMVEEVLHLVPEDIKLVCSNAISAARRRANQEELTAVRNAAKAAAAYGCCAYSASSSAADAAACAADYAANDAYYVSDYDSGAYVWDAANIAATAAGAGAANYFNNANVNSYHIRYNEEKKKQCNILRKHFTLDQVKEAFYGLARKHSID